VNETAMNHRKPEKPRDIPDWVHWLAENPQTLFL
jgi:hypothetical protein